jgi:hypothetical protein
MSINMIRVKTLYHDIGKIEHPSNKKRKTNELTVVEVPKRRVRWWDDE